jgi:RimJ/RimL family protein N-acetyltransferase
LEIFFSTCKRKENLKKYIQIAQQPKKENRVPLIVFDKKSWEICWQHLFYDINFAHKTLQLGYTWYGEAFRGTGLNKHCKLYYYNLRLIL